MAAFGQDELKERIARWAGETKVPRRVRVVEDTSDYFRVDYDDVVLLDGHPYFIRNYEREGRFGIDDEPKFWVRRAVDLEDGETVIVKMPFFERFTATIGGVPFECVRNPRKEARILELTRGNGRFMQGRRTHDQAGNPVLVIEYIKGTKYHDHVHGLGGSHEEYFFEHFPSVLDEFLELSRAIGLLHGRDERHGDIRRDHIILDRATGIARWIDFDFFCHHPENPWGYDIFGLGNVLAYLVGRGDVTVQELRKRRPAVFQRIRPGDRNIVFANRVVNLEKVYPYIPAALTRVLMHFSPEANVFYERIGDFLEDLGEAREALRAQSGKERPYA